MKEQVQEKANSLPPSEIISLPIISIIPDFSVFNPSETTTASIYDDIKKDKWKINDTNVLMINKANGKHLVFNRIDIFNALKQYHVEHGEKDPKFEYVRCEVFTDLDYIQKALLSNPTNSLHSQKPTTIIQKVSFLLLFFF